MKRIIELGTISSRGQIAIPSKIRGQLELNEGEKVLFVLDGDTLIIKKVMTEKTWAEVTHPLREAKKKISEEEVVDLVHKVRREKRENKK
jgi:AbrB family looped-hinge helix DNA binding protein